MMTFPIYGTSKNSMVPNHQPVNNRYFDPGTQCLYQGIYLSPAGYTNGKMAI